MQEAGFGVCRASGNGGPWRRESRRAVYLSGSPSLQLYVWTLNSSFWPACQLHCSRIVEGQRQGRYCISLVLAGRSLESNKLDKWKNAKGKLRKVRYINMEETLEKWASEHYVVIGEIIWPCPTLWSIVCDLLSQWRWGPNRTIVMEAVKKSKLETD